jgi:hypothetical protein
VGLTINDMPGLITLIVLIAIGAYGIRLSTDTPLDRVDTSLWPYLHH